MMSFAVLQQATRLVASLRRDKARGCAAVLALCGIVLVWGGILLSLSMAREAAGRLAAQNAGNLARAFAENVVRTISALDHAVLSLRTVYLRDPSGFDINKWTASTQALTEMTTQFALTDRNGSVITGTNTPADAAMDISDREEFETLRDSPNDELFIGKPIVGRATHKLIIVLARKLLTPGGVFDGVAFASLDPDYLRHFYESVDLGKTGTVWLTGTDGVVRASGGRRTTSQNPRDDGTRIVARDQVRFYPLIVSVGIGTDVALAGYATNRAVQYVLGAAVTGLIIVVLVMYLRRDARLQQTRNELQAGMAEKSDLLETTLENISQGILMVGPDDRIQIFNRRFREEFGLSDAFLAARPPIANLVRCLWHRGEYEAEGFTFEEWLQRITAPARAKYKLYEHTRPNGVVLEVRSRELPNGGFVRTYSDITARKLDADVLRAASEAAHANIRAKSAFLATMSHEIRSPLSAMLGVLELLRATRLEAEQSAMANMIENSGQMLLAVLNDVLDFTKIEAEALSVAPEPTALHKILNEIVQTYVGPARQKGIAVTVSIDDSVPAYAITDALRLRQIIGNLLSNALKFTQAGQVALRAELSNGPDKLLRVVVRDSGIGMDSDTVERLFQPFMQADRSTTRKYGGTGLGLCISDQLARLLGGRLSVTSRLGVGSEFLLELPAPACATPPHMAANTDGDAAHTAVHAGLRVLLVDDDPTNRWLGRRKFEQLGLEVEVAEDGQAGLEAALAKHYHLIVTDLHMPRMDGVGLTHALRNAADPALRRIPIIALTADATAAQRERGIAAGITELAIKPLTTPALVALLARILPRGEDIITTAPNTAAPALYTNDLPDIPFDPQIYLSFLEPGDPEGAAWLGEYLDSARRDVAELDRMLAQAIPQADAVAQLAHRLSGASFSAGAITMGRAARALELAAQTEQTASLRALHTALSADLASAAAAIDAFLSTAQLTT